MNAIILKMKNWRSHFIANRVAWLVFLLGLILTADAAYFIKKDVESDALRQFIFDCNEVTLKIDGRLQAHKQVLLGGAALFDVSVTVEREQWKAYAKRMQVDRHFNGIQGLGFAILIPRQNFSAHIAMIRGQGFPQYDVRPVGDREVYSSVIYLEPFRDRNLRAFGYDMYSDPVRRIAMEQARDENLATLSGKVVLVQETEKDVQAGTLMYVPVYRKNMPIETIAERRSAIVGWVYSPFRMNDLMKGVIDGWHSPRIKHMHLKIYDGSSFGDQTLLYDSEAGKGEVDLQIFKFERVTDFNGRTWTLQFSMVNGSATGIDYSKVWGACSAGIIASMLLFFLLLSYLNTQRNAHRIADELTGELRKRVEAERILNEQLQIQSSALNASANGIVITGVDGIIEWANAAFSKLTGYTVNEAIGLRPNDLVKSGRHPKIFYKEMWDTILSGRSWHGEIINRKKDHSVYEEEMTITPVISNGVITHFIAIKQDISERKRAEEALRESESRWKFALEGAGDGLWDWKIAEGTVFYSKRWKEMLGFNEDEIGNQVEEWEKRIHPGDKVQTMTTIEDCLIGKTSVYISEHRVSCKNGSYKWILDRGMVVSRGNDGQPLRMIGTHADITDRHLMEEQIRNLAFYDTLTGLPNRRMLNDRLIQTIAASKRNSQFGSLMFLDLDNFKPLNDMYGHVVGDLLLIEVATRLKTCVREIDTVARFGGDEFIVLLKDLGENKKESSERAGIVAEKIRISLSELYFIQIPAKVELRTVEHHCTASIGVVMFQGHEISPEELLKQADLAMYKAKENGRNQVWQFDQNNE